MKTLSRILIGWMIVALLAGPAVAHKVNLFAYVEGGKVFTESYFPDGKPVESGKIFVYDSGESLLLEGKTDAKGLFSFLVPKLDDLKIVVDASMGHKNSFHLKKAEVEAGK
ncbi:MAG: carboxypeptidase regulatory-like domain-containing protein [Pseudomonadota bacterium]